MRLVAQVVQRLLRLHLLFMPTVVQVAQLEREYQVLLHMAAELVVLLIVLVDVVITELVELLVKAVAVVVVTETAAKEAQAKLLVVPVQMVAVAVVVPMVAGQTVPLAGKAAMASLKSGIKRI
jgi:hypothetical protein